MTTIQPSKVNRVIVDVLRPELERAIKDATYALTDPLATTRVLPFNSAVSVERMVEIEFPKRQFRYPLIILSMPSVSGGRLDIRQDMWVHQAIIRYQILAKSTTDAHNALNGIKEFLERDFTTLCAKGLIDTRITGTTMPTERGDNSTFSATLSTECTIYSRYVPAP